MKKKAVVIVGAKLLVLGGAGFLAFTGLLRAQDKQPEFVDTNHAPEHLALLDFKRGNLDLALSEINEAEKAHPDDIPIKVLKARILIEQHDFDSGERLLRTVLTPNGPFEVQMALGDLLLRKHDFEAATDIYSQALKGKPDDPDVLLDLVYTRVSVSDFISAGKYFSQLKPLDPDHPSYYFAKAAIAQATGKASDAGDAIQVARTIYGNTVTDRYFKTYLEVFAPSQTKSPAARAEPPPVTNAAPSVPHP